MVKIVGIFKNGSIIPCKILITVIQPELLDETSIKPIHQLSFSEARSGIISPGTDTLGRSRRLGTFNIQKRLLSDTSSRIINSVSRY